MRRTLLAILIGLVFHSEQPRAEEPKGWQLEVTPYLWMAGIDGDVTVGDQTVGVDVGFDDLVDALDFGGSLLTVVQYNRWVLFGQVDFFALDSDGLDNAPSAGKLETDALFATVAFGHQFQTFGPDSSIDVLGGVRYFGMDNTLTIYEVGSADANQDWVDGIVMLRPSFRFLRWFRFNPTLAIGTGDSDLTYEMQPQFQIDFTKHTAARIGYRRLYYKADGDRGNSFDGTIGGMIAGLGMTF